MLHCVPKIVPAEASAVPTGYLCARFVCALRASSARLTFLLFIWLTSVRTAQANAGRVFVRLDSRQLIEGVKSPHSHTCR